MKSHAGPTFDNYQAFIFFRTYSRFRDDLGRRETWEEAVDRYIAFMQENMGDKFKESEYADIRNAILSQQVMPSMRLLWSAGEAARRSNMTGYNCFAGDEKFMTVDGDKKFHDVSGTRQIVLSGDGEWREAEIRSFGKQKLNEVIFRPGTGRSSIRIPIRVTSDHRWITQRGEVTDLQVGDSVPFLGAPEEEFNIDDFIRGFGFGDGTITQRGRAQIRLCGDKNKFLPLFEEFGNSSIMSPQSYRGDSVVIFHKGWFENWKEVPPQPSYWWLMGYYEADGYKNPAQPGISTQNCDAESFILGNSAYSGLAVTGINYLTSATKYGPRSSPLAKIGLRTDIRFYVVDIKENVSEEEVYCAIEPVTHSFSLARGIHTGNCAFCAPSRIHDFADVLYIMCSGTGVGFSVEQRAVDELPTVVAQTGKRRPTFVVPDSKEGWADALVAGMEAWYEGEDIDFDYSLIRPLGARLKTFGGRASGSAPLKSLLSFTKEKILSRQGQKLRPIDVHDILCKTGEVVVSGGSRRSAMISLSDLDDGDMRHSKTGAFWEQQPQRTMANNSAVYTQKPTLTQFMREWMALAESGTGERGIFNRGGLAAQIPARRLEAWRRMGVAEGDSITGIVGVNPCGEINLLSNQNCNLTEIIARSTDTEETLLEKVRIATMLGTYQSTLTKFKYVSSRWKKNCDAERLLGVSITGQFDCPAITGENGDKVLEAMREHAIKVNKQYAKRFGINESTAITTTKPSGTVSQLVNSSSGAHPRFSKYYIRRVRISSTDPLFKLMRDQGVPYYPEVGYTNDTAHTFVLEFPVASPRGAITNDDVTALAQLEHWKKLKVHYTEHNPSVTIYVGEDEWLEVGAWVWRNWESVGGLSFLPRTNHVYQLAPYEAITEERYKEMVDTFPKLDFSLLSQYETEDQTTGAKDLACSSGVCSIDDVVAPVV